MTTKSQFSSGPEVNPYQDQGRLHALQVMLASRAEALLAHLEVNCYKSRRMFHGCCPVHGGSNVGGLNLYHEGDTRPGYWRCNTRGCEKHFKKTIIGFVRGVLSHQRYGWTYLQNEAERYAQKTVSWRETVDFCCDFLGTRIADIEVNYAELEKMRFAADVQLVTRTPSEQKGGLTRSQVRQHLEIPSTYFVNRGWSPEVLDRYDVGFYPALVDQNGKPKPLANRVAVPVYDNLYRYVVGFTGRSVFPQCSKCGRYHDHKEACPAPGDLSAWGRTAKWFNHNLRKESHLYNYWFAKGPIRDTGVVIVVEGPGDVWRAEEAGLHNSVALFGVHMSDEQQVTLEMSGAMHVVVLTNADEAGQGGREDLKKRLGRSFRLHFPQLPANDLGDMSREAVRGLIQPIMDKYASK